MIKTYLKAKCRRTGKWFGLEVEKDRGPAVITNFVDITEEMANHISPQYSVDENIETGRNLIACKYCRSRRFAGCSCNKNRKTCRPSDKYDFQCVYCNELEIDYFGADERASGDFYNHVNVSNLPRSAFDKHGNPQGDQFDLAKDGSMKGFTVVVLNYCSAYLTIDFTKYCLEKKGFKMIYYTDRNLPGIQELRGLMSDKKTQLWLISGASNAISNDIADVIVDSYKAGRGVYIWGDNDPWFKDANVILQRLYGISMFGDVPGGKNISIQTTQNGPGIIAGHPIGTGIINFYEGVTIATIPCRGTLRPLVYGSAGNIVTAYDDSDRCRLLADGGFTRLYVDTDKAGTERYVVNAAVWLANLERVGMRNLPKL